jgi:hypothetical protein
MTSSIFQLFSAKMPTFLRPSSRSSLEYLSHLTARNGPWPHLLLVAIASCGSSLGYAQQPTQPSHPVQPVGSPIQPVTIPPLLVPTKSFLGNIQTISGSYLIAVNNGGIGGPNSGPGATALHTDATQAQSWETFTLIVTDASKGIFSLKTFDGHYVTAVNGGGIAGSPSSAIGTNGTSTSLPGTLFTIAVAHGSVRQTSSNSYIATATLQTGDGRHYVTAVNGGGFGGPNNVPIHTDATALGAWETFTWQPQMLSECPPLSTKCVPRNGPP